MEAGNLVVVLTDDPVFGNIIPFWNSFGNIELDMLVKFNPRYSEVNSYHFYVVFHARFSNPP